MKKLIANTCLIGAVGMTMSACVITPNNTDTFSNYDNGNDENSQVITVSSVVAPSDNGLLQASNDNSLNDGQSSVSRQSNIGSGTSGSSSTDLVSDSQQPTEEDVANADGMDKEANQGSSSQQPTEEDIANGDGMEKEGNQGSSSQEHDKDDPSAPMDGSSAPSPGTAPDTSSEPVDAGTAPGGTAPDASSEPVDAGTAPGGTAPDAGSEPVDAGTAPQGDDDGMPAEAASDAAPSQGTVPQLPSNG